LKILDVLDILLGGDISPSPLFAPLTSAPLPVFFYVSLSHCLSSPLSLCLSASLPLCLSASPSFCLSFSLPHCLTFSLPLCPNVDRVGLRGPGEKQLESDKRQMKFKISALNKLINSVRTHRCVSLSFSWYLYISVSLSVCVCLSLRLFVAVLSVCVSIL
jgi:hypothetical protein